MTATSKQSSLTSVLEVVRHHRCLLLRLSDSDFLRFQERRDSGRGFTIAIPTEEVSDVRPPTVCLIFSETLTLLDQTEDWIDGHIGVLTRNHPLTAVQRGLKVARALPVDPGSLRALAQLIAKPRAASNLERYLMAQQSAISLPPDLSTQIITALASRPEGRAALEAIAPSLHANVTRPVARQLQADAIASALEIFGLATDAEASKLELAEAQETELSRYWLREDPVIERDAHHFPGLSLKQVHVTGRATFRRGDEALDVLTANRGPLEHVFGVDLIYHNLLRSSLVMVQYKMLNPYPMHGRSGKVKDWIYRPDSNLTDEINRMKRFRKSLPILPDDYRLNSDMFYMKFVRRDKIGSSAAITMPLEHFEQIRNDPKHKGPRGALRVSYRSLNGAYLRDEAFYNLVRSGYIGAPATITSKLVPLIDGIARGDRTVVVAIARAIDMGSRLPSSGP